MALTLLAVSFAILTVLEIAKAAKLDVPDDAGTSELLKAAFVQMAAMTKQVEELLKRAAPPKARILGLTKAEDIAGDAPTVAPISKADGTVDDVATEIKKAQQRPVAVTLMR